MPTTYIADGTGTYKAATDIYVADATGTWKKTSAVYVADATGAWKKVHPPIVISTNQSQVLYYCGGVVSTGPCCSSPSILAFYVRYNSATSNIQVYFNNRGTWSDLTTNIIGSSAVSSGYVDSAMMYGACWRNEGEFFRVHDVTVTATTISGYVDGWDQYYGFRWANAYFAVSV